MMFKVASVTLMTYLFDDANDVNLHVRTTEFLCYEGPDLESTNNEVEMVMYSLLATVVLSD